MNAPKDRVAAPATSPPRQQRDFERRQLLEVVAMIWDEHQTPPMECVCQDISTSGILIETHETLPLGKHLRLSLHNRQTREHMGTLLTRVVREQKNKWGGYNIGLEIVRNRN